MDRPRHRRRDPERTGPIRNAGGALREGEPRRDPTRRGGDAASRGVREGYRVIEEQIRRGRRMAQSLDDEPRDEGRRPARGYRERGPWPGYEDEESRSRYGEEPPFRYGDGPARLLGLPMRQLERLVREILRQIGSARPNPLRLAGLLFELQIEAIAELTRFGFGALGMASPRWEDRFDEDVDRVERDVEEGFEEAFEEVDEEERAEEGGDEPWEWPPAPSAPTVIRASVPIPVYVWSHERTEIDLDLPAGSQSQDLEVETPMAAGTGRPPLPAFEAEFVALADGPAILRVEVPRELPAGRYLRRVVTRATGEPVGTLTVQVGAAPGPRPGPGPKSRPKPGPRAGKP